MTKPRHYSPALSRSMVSALYHGAKARKIPMTQFADQLLSLGFLHLDPPTSVEPRVLETPDTTPIPRLTAQAA